MLVCLLYVRFSSYWPINKLPNIGQSVIDNVYDNELSPFLLQFFILNVCCSVPAFINFLTQSPFTSHYGNKIRPSHTSTLSHASCSLQDPADYLFPLCEVFKMLAHYYNQTQKEVFYYLSLDSHPISYYGNEIRPLHLVQYLTS